MKLTRLALGLALLAGLYVGVAAAVRAIHLPLPGNLVALFVLLAILWTRVLRFLPAIVSESIEAAADLLLRHLSLLFVPAAVAVVRYAPLVKTHLGDVALILIVSTIVVLLVTGAVAERLLGNAPKEEP